MSAKSTQKLSIRLIKDKLTPADAVRTGELMPFSPITGAMYALGTSGGKAPKWASFLKLSSAEQAKLKNSSAYAVIFVEVQSRWFVASFGGGFQRLDPAAIEQDFGLRVVVNTVDHKKLRSADLRTPNDNTTTTRTQVSRQSSQEVFEIDHERDLIRGLEGTPSNETFASRVVGSDALTLWRKTTITDLPQICQEALAAYAKKTYQRHFSWIDHIRHERDIAVIAQLDVLLLNGLNQALTGSCPESLHLAWPVIYDPSNSPCVHYAGFRSTKTFPDLDIRNYIDELKAKSVLRLAPDNLKNHMIVQTNDEGERSGDQYRLHECCVYEVEHANERYVLSSGRWYKVARKLAKEVAAFFNQAPKITSLPAARSGENEKKYNERLKREKSDWICFDTHEIRPSEATSDIEPCDFWDPASSCFIHIKNETSSSKLSHLFNQGSVSARVFKTDAEFRQRLKDKARELAGDKLASTLPSEPAIDPSKFTVLFAVMREPGSSSVSPILPFFSLVTFRQAAKQVEALGFRYAFAWIFKTAPAVGRPKKRKTGGTKKGASKKGASKRK